MDRRAFVIVIDACGVGELPDSGDYGDAGTFARLDPHLSRTVVNHGEEPAAVLIVSAPRGSGYEPMDWA